MFRCIRFTALAALCTATGAMAQSTTLLGTQFTARSTGAVSGATGWSLGGTGFVGSYLVVPAGGATVNFNLSAAAGAGGSASPHVNIVVADSSFGFALPSTSATNYVTPNVFLPGGTYFVRTERDFSGNVATNRASIINSLSVNTVGGGAATFSNVNTAANALAAADTYIQHFRQGRATVALTGPGNIPLLPGTQVNVDLVRHAFNFGNAVPGVSITGVNNYLGSNNTAQQLNYQARLNQHFNAIVPENAGKWASNEGTRDVNTLTNIDAILNYAQSHNMRARMHNGIWGNQQPGWAINLLNQAASGNTTAKNDLRGEITERIDYYVGTGSVSDRANRYLELDVYNETVHTGVDVPGSYWNVYGVAGIADIHREVKAAAPNLRTFVNEYNVYADGDDKYANWFMEHTEQLRRAGIDAGFGDVVGGIGTQYYVNNAIQTSDPNAGGTANDAHNSARMMQTVQNLSTQGLPISLTEFGVKSGATQATAATMLSDAMRITFGNASTNGFFMWGFHAENGGGNLFAPAAALFNVSTSNWNNWTITEAGKVWQDLLGIADWDGNPANAWDTNVIAVMNHDGAIEFTGFFGDYNIGGQPGFSNLNLLKGTTQYSVNLAAPPGWHFWNTSASGNWNSGGNWTNGVAGGAGQTAHFGNSASPRTVTVDAPIVVGMINFDSSGTYTVSGNAITLQGLAGVVALNVVNGSHTLAAPISLNANLNVKVASPASTLSITNGLQAPARTVNKSGAGTLRVAHVRVSALNVLDGDFVVTAKAVANDPAGESEVTSLSFSGNGRFDLTNNALFLSYPGSESPIDEVREHLADGRLISSLATASHRLGYVDDGANVRVRFTFAGDSDLDGDVDVADLGNLASAWQTSGYWSAGDFDYSGYVDVNDLGMLATNWQAGVVSAKPTAGPWAFADALQSFGLPVSAVPEPSSVAVSALGMLLVRRRRAARQENRV